MAENSALPGERNILACNPIIRQFAFSLATCGIAITVALMSAGCAGVQNSLNSSDLSYLEAKSTQYTEPNTEFTRFIAALWPRAEKAGISRAVYDKAFGAMRPDPEVLRLANRQAEFTETFETYLNKRVSNARISAGQERLRQHTPELLNIEARYGVDRHVLLAIWGMETFYGAVLGNKKIVRNVIRSLATLAFRGGKRRRYGTTQLIAALKILQNGDIPGDSVEGSWAGAMGHTQFIPTTYQGYAVDFDGDGRRNIWTSIVDALASSANYLGKMGWRSGQTWGYEVALPQKFDYRLANGKIHKSLNEWETLKVKRVNGQLFPRTDDTARLFLPSGAAGPAFLLLHNFDVILRYNNAHTYALATGHLADRIRGGEPFRTPWPNAPALDLEQRKELQLRLTMNGYAVGDIDGKIGSGTRAAIRKFQEYAGLLPDGHPSIQLLRRLQRLP